uniref:DDE-1 domain-containing protein n=1 Tax=Timema genevievae TaxID=629358 RepID=A0A7R9JWB8_TIMGE|nr:unnamed protein product [Timema genevievae]
MLTRPGCFGVRCLKTGRPTSMRALFLDTSSSKINFRPYCIAPSGVKAVLLVENAPSHPIEKMCRSDLKIKCLTLTPNTSSLLQPMDQDVVLTCKIL